MMTGDGTRLYREPNNEQLVEWNWYQLNGGRLGGGGLVDEIRSLVLNMLSLRCL